MHGGILTDIKDVEAVDPSDAERQPGWVIASNSSSITKITPLKPDENILIQIN